MNLNQKMKIKRKAYQKWHDQTIEYHRLWVTGFDNFNWFVAEYSDGRANKQQKFYFHKMAKRANKLYRKLDKFYELSQLEPDEFNR